MKRYLNRKTMIASFVGMTLLFIMVFMNYVGTNNIQEPVGANNIQEPLPVLGCTTTYPYFMLSELAEHSDNIVNAQVVGVGETIMKPVYVNLSEVPSDSPDDTLCYPVTPVESGYDEQIYYALDGILSANEIMISRFAARKAMEESRIIMYALGGGISGILALIGIFNFVNVISVLEFPQFYPQRPGSTCFVINNFLKMPKI